MEILEEGTWIGKLGFLEVKMTRNKQETKLGKSCRELDK